MKYDDDLEINEVCMFVFFVIGLVLKYVYIVYIIEIMSYDV